MRTNKPGNHSARHRRSRRLLMEPLESRRLLATSQSSLLERVAQHIDNAPGLAGAAIVNLTSGAAVMVNADTEFSTSSTIKAGILYALLRRIDSDPNVSYDTIINSGNQFGDNQGEPTDKIPDLQANTEYTVTFLASTMIANSNNWATNRLIQFLGMNYINQQFTSLGLKHTKMERYMSGAGAPSAHGNSNSGQDYREGFDNVSTAREFTTFLRKVHQNNGLLDETSHQLFWQLMGQDSDLGPNTNGNTDDLYNAGVFGGWTNFITRYSKPGSNTWNGNPGDFEFDENLGSHLHRSDVGRLVFTNTGDVVFYTTFVNFAPAGANVGTPLAQVGYEIAAEFAEAPATYTPASAQLDDGRALIVRGTANADNIRLIRLSAQNAAALRVNSTVATTIPFADSAGNSQLSSVTIFGRAGNDYIELGTLPDPVSTTVLGESGNDRLIVGSSAIVRGGSGNDSLTGSSQNDFLYGEAGFDRLSGGAGNDYVDGGSNNDILLGGHGDDQLLGSWGSDTLQGDDGKDTLSGGYGNDTLRGGVGNDLLSGDAGDDLLVGEGDSDKLYGGEGSDQLIGGLQTADVSLPGDPSADVLDGGTGNDSLLGDDGQFLPLTIGRAGGNDTLRGGSEDDRIYGQGGHDQIIGQTGNDQIDAGDGDDHIQGQAGDDTIDAGDGNDIVFGGAFVAQSRSPIKLADGADFIDGGAGDDTLYGDNWQVGTYQGASFGGSGDTLLGNAGNDQVFGQSGDDHLTGAGGNDKLSGGWGADTLDGGDGNDLLLGEAGIDALMGGLGSDLLFGGTERDKMGGGDGEDLLLAGTTAFDTNSAALAAISAEWFSKRAYRQRIANLTGKVDSQSGPRLNGDFFLRRNQTVLADIGKETLAGGLDADWFFADPADTVTDLESDESVM